ncbi:hypothetical protein HNY73_011634 [Argiope bruennichi]|uniref:Uncharacterized protein n=1 Tax=Argiope bruennichi TaxID=94029 RepID=A0A8T0EZA6_ARGBR|nr:hypothetical protein HNY73_011634 [Argiope bruennichi]
MLPRLRPMAIEGYRNVNKTSNNFPQKERCPGDDRTHDLLSSIEDYEDRRAAYCAKTEASKPWHIEGYPTLQNKKQLTTFLKKKLYAAPGEDRTTTFTYSIGKIMRLTRCLLCYRSFELMAIESHCKVKTNKYQLSKKEKRAPGEEQSNSTTFLKALLGGL